MRWDLLAPVGMQIILVGRSTLAMVPYHRSRQPHYTVKSPALQLFQKVRDKAAYDEKYVTMRKNGGHRNDRVDRKR